MEPPIRSGEHSSYIYQWMAEARGGSPAAMGRLLELCRQYLLLVANREMESDLKAKGGASDLVQETFLEAQRDFSQFHGRTHAALLAWLRRILLNNLCNFRRHFTESEKRQIARERPLDGFDGKLARSLEFDASSPSSHYAANEESRALDRALQVLPADYREVIILRHEQGLHFAQVGELMDRSAEAARKLWTRAIRCLREELEKH